MIVKCVEKRRKKNKKGRRKIGKGKRKMEKLGRRKKERGECAAAVAGSVNHARFAWRASTGG